MDAEKTMNAVENENELELSSLLTPFEIDEVDVHNNHVSLFLRRDIIGIVAHALNPVIPEGGEPSREDKLRYALSQQLWSSLKAITENNVLQLQFNKRVYVDETGACYNQPQFVGQRYKQVHSWNANSFVDADGNLQDLKEVNEIPRPFRRRKQIESA